MDTKKLKSKLKSSGIVLTVENENLFFTPIKRNLVKFYLIVALGIPGVLLCVFYYTTSILGIACLVLGGTMIYHGIKSRNEAAAFNKQLLKIEDNHVIVNDAAIPLKDINTFKSSHNSNQFFPNVDISMQTQNEQIPILKIWNKNNRYLTEDKFEITQALNEMLSD